MNVKTLLIVAFFGISSTLSAQSKYIREANDKYYNESYCEAAGKCALAYSKIARKSNAALKTKGDMAWKTAESYRQTENAKEAREWYDKAILLRYQDTEPLVYLRMAEVLMTLREFDEAGKYFGMYKEKVPDDIRGENGLKSAQLQKVDDFRENRTRHEISKVSLNTAAFEMAPAFVDRKGSQFAFTSTRKGSTGSDSDPRTCEPYSDIYVTTLNAKGDFSAPALIDGEGINTEDNEGTAVIDGRGKTMFFTRCPNVKKMNLGCDIWMSEGNGKKWNEPVKLSLKTHDSISVGHPCVSDDGRFLIFVSDYTGDGSIGGHDLWYTTYDKRSDSWTAPVNMGPEINTPGDEYFPTFAMNGDLLYSSNGLPGMGGLDIFRAAKVGTDNKWENPTHMGAPINSEFNDYGLLEVDDNLKTGYFTSERKDSEGGTFKPDIYKFVLPPNLFTLKVVVSDLAQKTKKIEGAKVTVTGNTSGDTWTGVTGKDGAVYWDKKPNGDRFVNENASYTIRIAKEGYHEDPAGSKITTVNLKYDQNFVVDMALLPKTPIRLPEVRYPLAKWDLLVDSTINSKDSLLYVYTLLTEYPNMVLELSSHTDSRGGAIYNQALSENRAKACYKYLVEQKGIDPRRLVPAGRGENQPRTVYLAGGKYMENRPEGGAAYQEIKLTEAYINQFKKKDPRTFEMLHQFNRRTEGRVLSLDFDPATAPAANPAYLKFMIPLPKPNK
jgi:peptidoglycan-associated lipoprotein